MTDATEDLFERAVAAFRGDDHATAMTICREVLAVSPQFAMAHHLSGVLHQATGDLNASLAAFEEAVKLDPELGNAHYNLGVILERMGRDDDARRHYETALDLDPRRFDALTNLGNVWFRKGDYAQAAAHLRRALDINSNHPAVHVSLSNVLRRTHDIAGALAALRKALDLDPDFVEALANLAALNEETNDLAAARKAAERAQVLDPDHVGVSMLLARCDRRDGDLEAALSRLAATDDTGEPLGVQRDVAFEKAMLLDRLDRPGEALEAMTACNRRALEMQPDASAMADRFVEKLDRYARAVDGYRSSMPDSAIGDTPEPVFVVGFPRSGTTLLGQVLDCHSGLALAEERPFLQDLVPVVSRHGLDYPKDLAKLGASAVEDLRKRFLAAFDAEIDRAEGQRPVHKFPLHLIHGGLMRALFPASPVILAMRHPCDVVLSCFMQKFRANEAMANFHSLERTAQVYEKVMRFWDRQCSAYGIEPHVVCYEDVVGNFDNHIGELLNRIGVPWEDDVRAFDTKARERTAIHTPSYAQVAEPLYDRAVYRWHRYASRLMPHVDRLLPWIERYGYTSEPT